MVDTLNSYSLLLHIWILRYNIFKKFNMYYTLVKKRGVFMSLYQGMPKSFPRKFILELAVSEGFHSSISLIVLTTGIFINFINLGDSSS